ncbi:Na+/H+ antiporter subunit A [Dermatophilus congolensis]|uniref:Na+/H+ antiporter subunit A n=1 Tax=Dermatophilus congolensis TaxID=1863 RepID=UPI001AAFE5AD|nr:Na+/H+ antiporter subunit A [Dermatophilus congolensis]MBO3147139.1 Na+/H+ antiporter subunit A [Dermatophilus congolensis]MBO3154526.1 Na+/H+ antiporter subunit A [Dermatophilus congolensis]MBO3172612.1 Na+/H+ antiporter subunit A [Dermatophilus congolensis]MBO3179360.1 Na+/H+ antiporter subunit A [Dermatophilus congolensis]
MVVLLTIHAVAAVLSPFIIDRFRSKGFWILAAPPAMTFAWALTQTPAALGSPLIETYPWIPTLNLTLTFRLDTLSWLLCLVVGGIGALVLAYCAGYFSDDEPGLGRFAGTLVAFAGAMLGLVTSDDALLLYLFWELTTVGSYLLVGHRPESRSSRIAATQALVVTSFGGLAMLIGIILLGEQAGTYRLSQLLGTTPLDSPITNTAIVLILIGALSKSAQVPFHFWLPGAMAAPTPVSAYLHAAAMVKAGIYLVARLAPSFADAPTWRPLVLTVGCATMIIGAYRSLRQHDLKLLLAFGTVSQLGFLIILVGSGYPNTALAGTTLLLAHALYKGALFLIVGAIDHSTGTRYLRRLSGLRHSMPGLFIATIISAASMAGLPPLLGFVGKEAAYDAYLHSPLPYGKIVLGVLVAGSALTLAYSWRFVWGAFRNNPELEKTPVHAPGPLLTGIPLILSAGSIALGIFCTYLEPILRRASDTPSHAADLHLALWHGITPALLLTLLTWAAGSVLILLSRHVYRFQNNVPQLLSARDAYWLCMRGLDRLSLETTGLLQRGSLPLSLSLILTVFIVVPGGTLLLTSQDWQRIHTDNAAAWPQAAIALVLCTAAIASVRSRRRLRAIFMAGTTGYGCAMMYLVYGAPDLALTQALAETFSIVVFVLVLRRLRTRFDITASTSLRIWRVVFGAIVGVIFTALALLMPALRVHRPASDGMAELAYPFGGGTNIVNIILVDIRAWDTMGEISVALAAATGIASLIFLREENMERIRPRKLSKTGKRLRQAQQAVPASQPGVQQSWLVSTAGFVTGERRSVLIEVVARLVFHSILLWSVYLLFAGHNAPGGGFAAGMVAGLALTVRYLVGGRDELRAAAPILPGALLGSGLFLSAGFGVVSMLFGGHVLQTWTFEPHLPLIGEVHFVTSVLFDVGVYLVVIGLVLDMLRSLGSALDRQMEEDSLNGRITTCAPDFSPISSSFDRRQGGTDSMEGLSR